MIYIISDIHGLYDRYKRLLDIIQLQDEDTLYVLGDAIDRGPDGIKILQDMMNRSNVVMFLGNHEHMMLMHLAGLDKRSWVLPNNGGQVTLKTFTKLNTAEQDGILDYLQNSYIVKNIMVNEKLYSLSHIGVFRDDADRKAKDIDLQSSQEMVWGQYLYSTRFIDLMPLDLCPTTFISGHIITRRYRNIFDDTDQIFEKTFSNGCRYIDIDCGCALGRGGGYLACIPIDENGEIKEIIYVK